MEQDTRLELIKIKYRLEAMLKESKRFQRDITGALEALTEIENLDTLEGENVLEMKKRG